MTQRRKFDFMVWIICRFAMRFNGSSGSLQPWLVLNSWRCQQSDRRKWRASAFACQSIEYIRPLTLSEIQFPFHITRRMGLDMTVRIPGIGVSNLAREGVRSAGLGKRI